MCFQVHIYLPPLGAIVFIFILGRLVSIGILSISGVVLFGITGIGDIGDSSSKANAKRDWIFGYTFDGVKRLTQINGVIVLRPNYVC